ncbi:carboxypeptidase-like regulatory domain-containing protein [Flagellimonas sp. 389]|uniref:carboxypeptidase-like regulatory domain-containing protein n=1 Tax=Flagellimonas sp. 389 TaxID=2835862 RepID=UPI001BD48F5A|nr:carboxypeptidase-like regulatory domain-containing protein [Flagellimonas sp. 389]MBS9462097.1 carboxypeptidase-like regulatory domain-containing protein [Flagellimonas sp. 389]
MKICYGLFLGCTILLSNILSAQLDYKGKILDAKSGLPIPYVNIGIIEKGVGTVSDEEGIFHLEFNPDLYTSKDVVLFSSLGYETLEIPISNLKFVYNEYPTLKLNPSILELNEVIVTDKKGDFVEKSVGYKNTGEKVYGYWKDNIALGGELASHISIAKGLRQLKSFGFEVWENISDSVLVRINVYDIDKSWGFPKNNLNQSTENILHTIKKNDMFAHVDLIPFSIFVRDDFIVSIELLQVYGKEKPRMALAGVSYGNGSFRKYASQDKWEKISEKSMAFFMETSYFVSVNEAERIRKREKRRKEKLPMISGFVIENSNMISNVTVRNLRTKEWTTSDENGRYTLHAKPKDRLLFTKKGYFNTSLQVRKRPSLNVKLKLRTSS